MRSSPLFGAASLPTRPGVTGSGQRRRRGIAGRFGCHDQHLRREPAAQFGVSSTMPSTIWRVRASWSAWRLMLMGADGPGGSGSDDEFAAFVRARGPALLRLATLLAGDRTAGEDLLQSVLERTYLRWSQVSIRDPEAYVREAMTNSMRSVWRRRRRIREQPTAQPPDRHRDGGEEVVHNRMPLLDAMRRLPAQQRLVVVLRFVEDLTEAEVATRLGCSIGTVKKQGSRALTRLRADPQLALSFGLEGELR